MNRERRNSEFSPNTQKSKNEKSGFGEPQKVQEIGEDVQKKKGKKHGIQKPIREGISKIGKVDQRLTKKRNRKRERETK